MTVTVRHNSSLQTPGARPNDATTRPHVDAVHRTLLIAGHRGGDAELDTLIERSTSQLATVLTAHEEAAREAFAAS